MDGTITAVIIYCCNGFHETNLWNAWGSGRLRRTRGHL